jgi:hypothetical protein
LEFSLFCFLLHWLVSVLALVDVGDDVSVDGDVTVDVYALVLSDTDVGLLDDVLSSSLAEGRDLLVLPSLLSRSPMNISPRLCEC